MTDYPQAIQRPGPRGKQGYLNGAFPNAATGAVLHSAEGGAAGMRAVLSGPTQVSWHFSVLKSGTVYQHYPLEAVCWHAGSPEWNERLVGIEHEGRAGEPLTAAQQGASVALVRWVAQECGWAPDWTRGSSQTLYEHRELTTTSCPSGRIPHEPYVSVRPLGKTEFVTAFTQLYLGWQRAGTMYEWGPSRRDADGTEHHEIVVRGRG